ncbi:alpha-protein kinase vwkA-like [Argopecten irradians]|uniref:alpha-protein kinase vwkA-like n=1 Tax=Argopecten irradians TaxID=31199 RepID=UPI00371970B8
MGDSLGTLFENETLSSEHGPYAVFDILPFSSGDRVVAFKGIITQPLAKDHVIKIFRAKTARDLESSYRRCSHYVKSRDIACEYIQRYGKSKMQFVSVHSAEMDRVSVFSRNIRSSDRRHKRRVSEKDVVVFEEYLGENFQTFIERDGTVNNNCCDTLQEFVHFVYNESKGQEIVTGLKGVVTKQGQKFKLTSPSMNSVGNKYGPDDLGEKAMFNFFCSHVCTAVCCQLPKPSLLHPFDGLELLSKQQNNTSTMQLRKDMPPKYDSKWRIDFENSYSFPPRLEPSAPPSYECVT